MEDEGWGREEGVRAFKSKTPPLLVDTTVLFPPKKRRRRIEIEGGERIVVPRSTSKEGERKRDRESSLNSRERGPRLRETSLTNATTFQTRLIGRLAASVNRAKTGVTRPLYFETLTIA